MTRFGRRCAVMVLLVFATACSETATPPTQATKASPPSSEIDAAAALAAVIDRPAAAAQKPLGPHGRHDPHGALDPERLIKVALQHDREGRLELALKTLADGIAKFPDAARLYAVRGSLRLQMQQVGAALADLERAVQLAPDDAQVLVNRAQAYRAFGRFDEALADLDDAVRKAPDLVAARFNRGALHYARRDLGQALADFGHCVAVEPHAPAPYFNRASTYWELLRPDDAMKDLERFLELADNAEWKRAAEDLKRNWETALAREPGADKGDS